MITPRTTGIIGVHAWGRPASIEALHEIADRHHLQVMFDAAHAFGCTHHGRLIGNFGRCEVLSFHATKFFNTFEGGAIVTNDDELARKMRLMKNFGIAGYDNVIYPGTNGKMTEVCAAMGVTGLESFDEFVAVNRRNYYAYRDALRSVPGISLIRYNESERCNYQYVVVGIGPEFPLSTTNSFEFSMRRTCWRKSISWPGCHWMQPYGCLFPHDGFLLPQTARLSQVVLVLPIDLTWIEGRKRKDAPTERDG